MAVKVDQLVKSGIALGLATLIAAAAVEGVPFLKGHEGLVLQTQPDIVGVQNYCYGETHQPIPGKIYTKPECDALLDKRFPEYALAVWGALTPEAQAALSPSRLLAYTSHAYNFGKDAFRYSTIARLANAGDVQGSCAHFMDWVYIKTPRGGLADRRDRQGQLTAKVDGKKDCAIEANKCKGIVQRRKDEMKECLK